MHLGAHAASRFEAQTELDALDGRDGEQRRSQTRGQTIVRRSVAAHARHEPRHHDAERAAQALARVFRAVDLGLHGLRRLFVGTAHLARLDSQRLVVGSVHERVVLFEGRASDGRDVREHLHTQVGQELARDAGRRHARSRLAGACALEDVAAVGRVGFERPHEVGVAGAWRDLTGEVGRSLAERGHAIGPVLPVPVAHHERDRSSQRAAEAHAGDDLHGIALDTLAAAAPVTGLTTRKVGVDLRFGDLQARGHAFDDGRQARTVALACC